MVIYRGASQIDPRAPVMREGKPVGVIAEVLRGQGLQRIIVHTPDAAALNRGDRFLPKRGDDGLVGLTVVPGRGARLANGAVVEAGFEPRGHAGSGGRGAAPKRAPSKEHDAELGPLASPSSSMQHENPARLEEDMERAGITEARLAKVPQALRGAVLDLPRLARSKSPDDAVEFLVGQEGELKEKLREAADEARRRGDKEAYGQLRKLEKQTDRIIRRLRVEALNR